FGCPPGAGGRARAAAGGGSGAPAGRAGCAAGGRGRAPPGGPPPPPRPRAFRAPVRGPASASGRLLPQLPDVLAGEVTKPIDRGELAIRRVDLLAGSELDQIIDHEARRPEQPYPRAVGELPVDAGIGLRPHHAPHPEV